MALELLKKKEKHVNLRISKEMLTAIDKAAKKMKITRSAFISLTLAEGLKKI